MINLMSYDTSIHTAQSPPFTREVFSIDQKIFVRKEFWKGINKDLRKHPYYTVAEILMPLEDEDHVRHHQLLEFKDPEGNLITSDGLPRKILGNLFTALEPNQKSHEDKEIIIQ